MLPSTDKVEWFGYKFSSNSTLGLSGVDLPAILIKTEFLLGDMHRNQSIICAIISELDPPHVKFMVSLQLSVGNVSLNWGFSPTLFSSIVYSLQTL